MKPLPKLLLVLALPTLLVGAVVSLTGADFAPDWTLALPLGVILLGLFFIAWGMQNEVAKFDDEECRKIGPARKDESAASGSRRAHFHASRLSEGPTAAHPP